MEAQFDPWAMEVFDLSRQFILANPTPPVQVANVVTNSTTRSTYRLHWNWLAHWEGFGDLVSQYWNQAVSQIDKQRNVYMQATYRNAVQSITTDLRVSNEGNIRLCIDKFVVDVHSAAANGLNGAPRPTDQHSKLQRWEQGVEAKHLAGIPDFVMASEYAYGQLPRRMTVMLEVKNPWQVTPALIDAVINSTIHSPH
jgi:hypothetical protein